MAMGAGFSGFLRAVYTPSYLVIHDFFITTAILPNLLDSRL